MKKLKGFSEGFGRSEATEKKFKGLAGVTIIIIAVLVVFFLLFMVGISSNYESTTLDPIGIGSFFIAVQKTVSEWVIITNTIVWTMAFFIVQGVFLFVYYKVGRFIWVHLPIYQRWFRRAKEFISG